VPVDTGTGVLTPVPAPDVEPRSALLPRARRADPLHCGGGYLFLDWAPLPGTPLPAEPVLPRDTHLADVAERYCSGEHYMSGTVVSISGLDLLLHRCIAAMIVRVYGSLATQRISGGQLLVMERVVVGRERFAWGLTLHARMIVQLDRCRSTGTGEFAFGSILVAWFLERVPMLRPGFYWRRQGRESPA
jgi:hypothetical protein